MTKIYEDCKDIKNVLYLIKQIIIGSEYYNMANYSICGIDCDSCKFKTEQNCKGCKTIEGKVFWGECDLYKCNSQKNQDHCGKCSQFPCDMLKEWASSENPERIDNLRKL